MTASLISATRQVTWAVALLVLMLVATAGPLSASGQVRSARSACGQCVIELPVDGSSTTLPLHVLAHVGQPGERVHAALRWENGTELMRSYTLLTGSDRKGLLVASLDWDGGSQPALPTSQTVLLQVTNEAGVVLGHRQLTILGPDNPGLRTIALYFVQHGDTVVRVQRRILSTPTNRHGDAERTPLRPCSGRPAAP